MSMDLDDELPTVLCCLCGVTIEPNPSNMCINCIQSQVDITSGISPNGALQWCKVCERWLNPPRFWVAAAPESKELLELCLKRIKGLNKVKLVDANFLWTEPHSKRLKVKLTVQQDLFSNTTVQQTAVIEFTIANHLCDMCTKEASGEHVWSACVQARQKVEHKRTFLHLEQIIVQQQLHRECTKVQEHPDGIDFFYSSKQHALRMVDFLRGVCPAKMTESQELISHDAKSNVAAIHFTYMVEIAPICKNDLLLLPQRYSSSMGGLGPFVICAKVNTGIVVMDPFTLQSNTIPASLYWKHPFEAYASSKQLTEFYILDVQFVRGVAPNGKYRLSEVQMQKADEVGVGQEYFTKTHLGGLLNPGDTVLGYMVGNLNTNSTGLKEHKRLNMPEVVLVRKAKQ
jgi:nonsense-mediated mRNA decay protein 3